MKNKIAKIVDIYVRHSRPGLQRKGSFMSRKAPYRGAKMTLWGITETGDHVWLETKDRLSSRRIEAKVQEYEEENENKIGRTIEYKPGDSLEYSMGFIRGYVEDNVDKMGGLDYEI